MIHTNYILTGSRLDAWTTMKDKVDSIIEEGSKIPNFHHVFFKAVLNTEFICHYQYQDMQNNPLSEFKSFNTDDDKAFRYYYDMVEYLTYGDAYFRIQMLPSLIFVVENMGTYPYHLEISSNQITTKMLGTWLADPKNFHLEDLVHTQSFGFKFQGFITNIGLAKIIMPKDTKKRTKQEEAKKLLDSLNKVNDLIKQKQQISTDTSISNNQSINEDMNVKVDTKKEESTIGLDKIFEDVTQHVESSKNEIPEVIKNQEPPITPLQETMDRIIESRNTAKMDETSEILKDALKNGTNPFENTTHNPYDKRFKDKDKEAEDPMSDIEFDNN